MNTDRDPVRDRIDAAERMLHQARHEYTRGNAEDAGEFLGAARRNIDRAGEALKKAGHVVELPRGKEANHAR